MSFQTKPFHRLPRIAPIRRSPKVSKSPFLPLALALLFVIACAPAAVPTPSVPPTAAVQNPTIAPPPANTVAPTVAPATTELTTTPNQVPTNAPTQAPSGISVTDSAGRQVTFPAVPTRIVSLAPSTTEIVCALNACDKLIGVDQFSDFPAQVKALPKMSDGFNPLYEQIVAAKPDLVLAAGVTSADAIKKLEDLKLTVLVVGAVNTRFESIKSEIGMVGKVLGADTQAASVVKGMDDKLAQIDATAAKATTKPRVYWELDATDPAKPFAPGPGSFIDEIITRAGGVNVAARATSPYPQLSAEEVIQANPQVIILSDAAYGTTPESVGKRPGWNVVAAVKDGKVFPIDDNLVSRPGPRVVDGLEAAAKLIHPDLFGTSGATGQTFDDPFAYCSAVGNVDTPGAPYTGPKVPPVILNGIKNSLHVTMPDDVLLKGTFWRCMDSKVYACNVGANIPCADKADTNKTPTLAETDYCKQNPNSDVIPAYITGHSTVYAWACQNGAPAIVKQVLEVDARGYPSNFWYEVKP